MTTKPKNTTMDAIANSGEGDQADVTETPRPEIPGITPEERQQMEVRSTSDLKSLETLLKWMADHEYEADEDHIEVLARNAAHLMGATNADDIIDNDGTTKAAAILGIPLYVESIKYLPSDFDGVVRWFAVLECMRSDTREYDVVSVGGETVPLQLAALDMGGHLPQTICIKHADRRTRKGRQRLILARPTY